MFVASIHLYIYITIQLAGKQTKRFGRFLRIVMMY